VSRLPLKLLLVFFDGIGIVAVWILVYWLRFCFNDYFLHPIGPFSHQLIFLPLVILIWLSVISALGIYRNKRGIFRIAEDIDLLKAMLIAGAFLTTFTFFIVDLNISRTVLTISIILVHFVLQLNRFIFAYIERHLTSRGLFETRVLIYGAGVAGVRLMHRMEKFSSMGYRVVGFIDDRENRSDTVFDGVAVLGGRENICDIVAKYKIDEIYIATYNITPLKIIQFVAECQCQNVEYKVMSNLMGVLAAGVNIEEVFDVPIVDLKRSEFGYLRASVKEVMDKLFSIILIILLLPAWLIIYIGLKLESPYAPVIIRQRRVGRGGGEFNMYKFRTMFPTVPKYQISPGSSDDVRITPFGQLLRKTALDETAQLINVLQGKMSLVGPRPDMPFVVAEYTMWQQMRLAVKPGISGMWQLAGRHDLPPHINIEMDFYYIQNQSLLLDIVILMKTLPVLVLGKALY